MNLSNETNQLIPPLSDRDHVRGSLNAAITLMKYGDYQCPQSSQSHAIVKAIQQQLGERLCFIFRHFPQTQMHAQAERAAESAEAAAAQGKFWEMHELLFTHPEALEDGDLVGYAAQLGLDMPRFLREMAEHAHRQRIQEDINSGRGNGVEETPTFFIGLRYEGTQNLHSLLLTLLENGVVR